MLFKVCHTSNFQTSVQVRSIFSLHAADFAWRFLCLFVACLFRVYWFLFYSCNNIIMALQRGRDDAMRSERQ